MSEALVPIEPVRVDLGVIRADKPAELVRFATEAANALAGVIESRKLYSMISGRRYVKCEGWTTLAAMLGVTPHEISVTEVEGAFTATVELRRLTDGQPVSRASAECGPDEATWKGRARYARRSMALTRATAKACRLAFSWIMALSGYEVTPAEEIPNDEPVRGQSRGAAPKEPVSSPPTAQPLTEKPAALTAEPMPWDPPPGVTADGVIEGPTRETLWPGPGPTNGKSVREWAVKHLRMADDGSVKVPDEWLLVVRAELKSRSFKSQIEAAKAGAEDGTLKRAQPDAHL